MTERDLVEFYAGERADHIYPLLEKQWSWEVDHYAVRKKWSLKPHCLLKQDGPGSRDLTDVDLFCLNNLRLDNSIAIEIKKLKVRSNNQQDSVQRQLSARVRQAAEQVDRLLGLGFPFVSLLFVITNDAHETNKGGIIWDSMSLEKLDSIVTRIQAALQELQVPDCVGLYILKLTESGGQSIRRQGAGGIMRLVDPSRNPVQSQYFDRFLRGIAE